MGTYLNPGNKGFQEILQSEFAYIAAIDQYLKVEELPSGKGIADVVYLPKPKSMLRHWL